MRKHCASLGVHPQPNIDYEALLRKLEGDESFAHALLGIARRSTAPLPGELRTACAATDYAALARIAHKIKGTAGDLVAQPLQDSAREAELAARAAQPDAVALNLQLAAAVDAFLGEIDRLVTPG